MLTPTLLGPPSAQGLAAFGVSKWLKSNTNSLLPTKFPSTLMSAVIASWTLEMPEPAGIGKFRWSNSPRVKGDGSGGRFTLIGSAAIVKS